MNWRCIVLGCVTATIAALSLITVSSFNDKSAEGEDPQFDVSEQNSLFGPYLFAEEPQRRRRRGTVARGKKIWNVYPTADQRYYTVPYAFGSAYTDIETDQIRTAMRSIEKRTCVRFERIDPVVWVATNSRRSSYVSIVNHRGHGCHAEIGRHRGRNFMRLEVRENHTCIIHHLVLHELLHLLGLYHEHQRPDRDRHILIRRGNIEARRRHNYNPVESAETHDLPYDFDSIMHYTPTTFARTSSRSGREKVIIQARNRDYQTRMGAARHGSTLDYLKVNLLYECDGATEMLARARQRWESESDEMDEAESVSVGAPVTKAPIGYGDGLDTDQEGEDEVSGMRELENGSSAPLLPSFENPLLLRAPDERIGGEGGTASPLNATSTRPGNAGDNQPMAGPMSYSSRSGLGDDEPRRGPSGRTLKRKGKSRRMKRRRVRGRKKRAVRKQQKKGRRGKRRRGGKNGKVAKAQARRPAS